MKAALEEFNEHKKFFVLVLLELVFSVFTALSFLNLINFNILEVISTGKYSFSLNHIILAYFLFFFSILVVILLFLIIRARFPVLYKAQNKAWFEIKLSTRQKAYKARHDPRVLGLLIIEIFFVFIVIISLSAFFDPNVELIPWSKAGIGPPATTIINTIIAVIVIIAFYWLYSKTAYYRHGAFSPKEKSLGKRGFLLKQKEFTHKRKHKR